MIFFLFKMRSANKVALMDAADRTYALAYSAACAFIVIYCCKIINNLYSAFGTGFFTLSASDTTVFTVKSDSRTLVMVITGYDDTGGIIDQMNDVVGAFLFAHSAANTLSRVDGSYSLLADADRITGTNLDTVTVAKACEGAEVIT